MAGGIKGITVEIGGDTTKLGKALADVNKSTSDLQSELKGVNTLLKMDPGNVTLLAQKQDILSQAIANTKQKLDTLKNTQEQVQRQFESGDIGADQYRDFQREIVATEQKLQKLTDELEGMDNSVDDINKVDKAIDEVGDSAQNTEGGFTVMKGALADLVSNVIQGAVGKIGDLVGQLFELSEATEEYRSMQGKLAGSADTFGYSVDFANSKYQEFYKYVGDDQMATNAVTNLMGLGTSTESISAIAEGAIGVWASYGDSIPIESLTESINETIQVGKVTGTMADTINWAKTSNEQLAGALSGNSKAQKAFNKAIKDGETAEDAFNTALEKTTSEQERADIVAKFLNSTYGDSKKTYDEMSGSITSANEAELKLKETQAQLGEAMAPVNTAFTNFKTQALEVITPLVEKLAEGFSKLLTWLKEHPVAMGILTGIVTALAVAFGILAGSLLITGIVNALTFAIGLLGGAFTILTSPISLIVIAIAGLVAGFLYLWNNCEGFRTFFINLWTQIQTAIKPVLDVIVNDFKQAWEWIKGVWAQVQPYFSAIWEKIKAVFSVVGSVLSSFFKVAWEFIKVIWSVVPQYFLTVWNSIKAVFSVVKTFLGGAFQTAWEAIKLVWSAVTGYFRNIWNTIKGIFAVVKAVLSGNWSEAWNAIKGIVSGWTSYFKGIWNGIKNVFSSVKSWFSNTFKAAWNAIKSVFSNWGSFFGGLWDKIKEKFSGLGTKLGDAIGGAVKSGINGVISAIESTINKGIGLINGAIGLINKLPGVSVGKINKLSLPRLAKGGIVDNPIVAEIGEDGREAIVPLEKNTGWINEIAKKLNNFGNFNNDADTALLDKLDRIYERLSRLQIVLDSGALVGETIDKIDSALADKQALLARGV